MTYKGIKEGQDGISNGCSGRILCRLRAPKTVNAEALLTAAKPLNSRSFRAGRTVRTSQAALRRLALDHCYKFRHACEHR